MIRSYLQFPNYKERKAEESLLVNQALDFNPQKLELSGFTL